MKSKSPLLGSLVHVRFADHLWFRNTEPQGAKPIIQEVWGILDYVCEDHIRLVVARYHEPSNDGKQRTKATGFIVLRKTILEIRPIA